MKWEVLRRRELLTAALLTAATQQPARAAVAEGGLFAAKVTTSCFLDIRIIQSYQVEVLEDAATRARLTFGLFGDSAPKGVAKFLDFVDGTPGQFKASGGGPAYSGAQFEKLQPGVLLEGGKIAGLRQTKFAGQLEYEYLGRLLPLRPVLEASDVLHDRRGLLTRSIFAIGPEFGITLAPAPNLRGHRATRAECSQRGAPHHTRGPTLYYRQVDGRRRHRRERRLHSAERVLHWSLEGSRRLACRGSHRPAAAPRRNHKMRSPLTFFHQLMFVFLFWDLKSSDRGPQKGQAMETQRPRGVSGQ